MIGLDSSGGYHSFESCRQAQNREMSVPDKLRVGAANWRAIPLPRVREKGIEKDIE